MKLMKYSSISSLNTVTISKERFYDLAKKKKKKPQESINTHDRL